MMDKVYHQPSFNKLSCNLKLFENKFLSEASIKLNDFPADICLLKVKNRNTRTRCEICSKLTIKTSVRRHWCRSRVWRSSGVFIVNFEHISQLVLVILLLTLNL